LTADLGELEQIAVKYTKLKETDRNADLGELAIKIIDSLSSPDFNFKLRKEALVNEGTTTYIYENNATYPSLFSFLAEILHSKVPIAVNDARFGPGEIIVADGNKEAADIKLVSAFKELRNLIHSKKTEAFSR
jgi:hypothetical protein